MIRAPFFARWPSDAKVKAAMGSEMKAEKVGPARSKDRYRCGKAGAYIYFGSTKQNNDLPG
jgi:hypothetical protein